MWKRFPRRRATFDGFAGASMSPARLTCDTRACAGAPGQGPRLNVTLTAAGARRHRRIEIQVGEADVRDFVPLHALMHQVLCWRLDQHIRDEAARWLRALQATRRERRGESSFTAGRGKKM